MAVFKELSDQEALRLLQLTLAAKFTADRSDELCQLSIANKCIVELLDRSYDDGDIEYIIKLMKTQFQIQVPLIDCVSAAAREHFREFGTKKPALRDLLTDWMFPYVANEDDIVGLLNQIYRQ